MSQTLTLKEKASELHIKVRPTIFIYFITFLSGIRLWVFHVVSLQKRSQDFISLPVLTFRVIACFVSFHFSFVFSFVLLRLIIMIIFNASILTFNILTFFCILLFLLVFVTSLCLGFLNFEIDTVVNTCKNACQ